MKFKLGQVHRFSLDRNKGIVHLAKHDVTGIQNNGDIIQAYGDRYARVEVGGKFLFIRTEDTKRFLSTTPNISTPGSILKLWNCENYTVPLLPDDDEWSLQDVQEMVNTYLLRETLLASKGINEELHALISKRGVSVFDRRVTSHYLMKQLLPLKKLIDSIDSLLEETATNF